MKSLSHLTALTCVLALLGASTLCAAKAKKKAEVEAPQVPAAKYDADNNGLLDATEKAALAKAFKDGSDGAIKIYDLDKDGTLTKEEIAQISLASDTASPAKKEKRKKR